MLLAGTLFLDLLSLSFEGLLLATVSYWVGFNSDRKHFLDGDIYHIDNPLLLIWNVLMCCLSRMYAVCPAPVKEGCNSPSMATRATIWCCWQMWVAQGRWKVCWLRGRRRDGFPLPGIGAPIGKVRRIWGGRASLSKCYSRMVPALPPMMLPLHLGSWDKPLRASNSLEESLSSLS